MLLNFFRLKGYRLENAIIFASFPLNPLPPMSLNFPTQTVLLAIFLWQGNLLAYEKVETIPPGFKMPKPLPLAESVASLKTKLVLR